MSLDTAGLQDDIEALCESGFENIASAASAWGDAMSGYAAAVVPASTLVATATTALKAALASAFSNTVAATTAAAMEAAFTSFATTVGTGMAPAFVATPPPGSVGFATLFTPPFPTTHAAAASATASAIDTWMRTGTATPSGGGSPVPWS